MGKVGVFVQIAVMPDTIEQFRLAFQEFLPQTLQEEGNVFCHILQDSNDPSKLFIMEMWESQKDLERHWASEHNKKFSQTIEGLYGPASDGFLKILTPFI